MIGSKVYDALKFLAQILVPALGTLYVALAAIYSWGHVDEVAGTVVAVDTFLGVLVSYLKLKYDASDKKYDGEINVIEHPDGKTIMAVDLFLGAILGLSTAGYNKSDERFDGEINVIEHPDGKTIMDMQLNKHEDPTQIKKEKTVLFRVNSKKAD
jgi:hypothetical protein